MDYRARQRMAAGSTWLCLVTSYWLAALPLSAQPAQTPEAVIAALRTALDNNDLAAVALHLTGETGRTLRQLAVPFAQCQRAYEQLLRAAKEKGLTLATPLDRTLRPFDGFECTLVGEPIRDKDTFRARIRCGPRGKTREETVIVLQEEGRWRLTAPEVLVRMTPTAARAPAVTRLYEELARVLERLAKQVAEGQIENRQAFLTAFAVHVAPLVEALERPSAGTGSRR